MTDINPDVTPKPIEVSESPAGTQAATASRDIGLVVAALPALVVLFGKSDIKEAVDYIASSGFAPVLALLVPMIVAARQWIARRKHAEAVKMARSASDSVAVVK